MNKRVFAVLLAATMLLLTACRTEKVPTASTHDDIPSVVSAPDAFREEAEPGMTETAESGENMKQTEETAAPAETENTEESATVPEQNTQTPSEPSESADPSGKLTDYEWYNSLSGEEQMAFVESFDSVPAFFEWYNAAKAEYEKLHPSIEIGDGVIDLGGN